MLQKSSITPSHPRHSLHFVFVNKSRNPSRQLSLTPPKKQGGSEEISKKMRNFVGAFDCIDKPNMPCGGHLNCKNNDLPSFSASQEPISSTR